MSDCASIDPLITPYVDGDIDAAARRQVDDHVRRCPPCHSRVTAERAVRELMRVKRAEIAADAASETLRARCAALRAAACRRPRAGAVRLARAHEAARDCGGRRPRRRRRVRLRGHGSLDARARRRAHGRSRQVLRRRQRAARHEPRRRGRRARDGVDVRLADARARAAGAGLELVGARPCLYAKGLAAHLMYRHHGQPLSVFMLPQLSRSGKPDERVDVMGHEAAVWSQDGRTFVLIAREPEATTSRASSPSFRRRCAELEYERTGFSRCE